MVRRYQLSSRHHRRRSSRCCASPSWRARRVCQAHLWRTRAACSRPSASQRRLAGGCGAAPASSGRGRPTPTHVAARCRSAPAQPPRAGPSGGEHRAKTGEARWQTHWQTWGERLNAERSHSADPEVAPRKPGRRLRSAPARWSAWNAGAFAHVLGDRGLPNGALRLWAHSRAERRRSGAWPARRAP
jgi:hypothetical protein